MSDIFVDSSCNNVALEELKNQWPNALLKLNSAHIKQVAQNIFQYPDKSKTRRTFRAYVKGTAFQVRVWRALLQVEPGTLVSYKQLAAVLGLPNAARAVGSAIRKNPLAYLIPCHRVIRETGVVGQYRWGGSARKRALLTWESSPYIANDTKSADHFGAAGGCDVSKKSG